VDLAFGAIPPGERRVVRWHFVLEPVEDDAEGLIERARELRGGVGGFGEGVGDGVGDGGGGDGEGGVEGGVEGGAGVGGGGEGVVDGGGGLGDGTGG